MKARQGFVSNSSSSSFVICGERISMNDVVLGSGKKYVAIESGYSDEGYSLYEVTKEFLELVPFINGDYEIWDVAFSCYEGGEITVEAGTYKLEMLEVSYHRSELDDMAEYYGIDRYAVLEAVLEMRAIPELIRDALSEPDKTLLGLYERGELTGDGVLQTLWGVDDD